MKVNGIFPIFILVNLLNGCVGSTSDRNNRDMIEWEEKLDVQWDAIDLNDDYRVLFFPINSDPFLNDSTQGKNVTDFMYNDSLYQLDGEDYRRFVDFVSDSANFTDGECGTFALNGGFVIEEFETIRGYVDMGCGFTDWEFYPFNLYSQGGHVSETGVIKMTEMLDEIYAKR